MSSGDPDGLANGGEPVTNDAPHNALILLSELIRKPTGVLAKNVVESAVEASVA
jgi:hypothetical protein